MPFGGVRIRGALVDDGLLNLEYARLSRPFWLEGSRVLVPVSAQSLRIDGGLSFGWSLFAQELNLSQADIREALFLGFGHFEGGVDLSGAFIKSHFTMQGSLFERAVNLNNIRSEGSAFLREGVIFKQELNMGHASIGMDLNMMGSDFEGNVIINSAKIGGSALLRDKATFKGGLDLAYASIGSVMDMEGSIFEGPVNMNSINVQGEVFIRGEAIIKGELRLDQAIIGSNLVMQDATFESSVDLRGAKIGAGAYLSNFSIFKGAVSLNHILIASSLRMNKSTFDQAVDLQNAKIGGALDIGGASFKDELDAAFSLVGSVLSLEGSKFEGNVIFDGTSIQNAAFLRAATFSRGVSLAHLSVGSSLDLSGSKFEALVNLAGAKIGGELRLGSSTDLPVWWGEKASLVLRNAHCSALQDRLDEEGRAWPMNLDLEGFSYTRLGGFENATAEANMLVRPTSTYIRLLERDRTASPQPYEHLAQVFRAAGEPSKANDILYEARERRRSSLLKPTGRVYDNHRDRVYDWVGRRSRWVGMSLLKETIGYGLGARYFLVLFWAGLFTVLGMVLLKFQGTQDQENWLRLGFVSLDALLPLITLDRAHEAILTSVVVPGTPMTNAVIAQPSWLMMYFYVHQLVGWILVTFFLAGLAGLTQRN